MASNQYIRSLIDVVELKSNDPQRNSASTDEDLLCLLEQMLHGLTGLVLLEGYDKIRVQNLPTRDPEVWRGLGCWSSSDVWSVGVTVSRIPPYLFNSTDEKQLVHWLSSYPIFGSKDKIVQGLAEAWCIAKVRRLLGPLDPPVNPDFEEEFLLAEHLELTTLEYPDTKLETPFFELGTLRQELERLEDPKVSPELIEFIEHLLVIDHTKRPTASEALQHPYLQRVPWGWSIWDDWFNR